MNEPGACLEAMAIAEAARQYRNARWDLQQVEDHPLWDASQKLRAIRAAAERLQQTEAALFEAVIAWEQGEAGPNGRE